MGWMDDLLKALAQALAALGKKFASPPAPTDSVFSGCQKAVKSTISEEVKSEIDSNSSNISGPLPAKTFCDTVADEYEKYFRTTHAGTMPANPTGLAILKTSMMTYRFTSWGSAFATYWSTTIWTPNGIFTGGLVTNSQIVGTAMQAEITALITTGNVQTMEEFADRIATILTTYTTKLIVQASISIPPNTMTVTVV